MTQYAKDTEVSVEKSQAEIKAIVMRYGATRYATMDDNEIAMIMFEIGGRQIRFELPLPDKNRVEFTHRKAGGNNDKYIQRPANEMYRVWERACRQRWRALGLIVKAKLEAVETGITTIEREFLANIILPNGQLIGDFVAPQLEAVYASGKMPKLLPGLGGTGSVN